MKKSTIVLWLLSLAILLTACAAGERSLAFSVIAEPGEYRPGDTVSITVHAENIGRKFSYIGTAQDHFSSPTLSLKTADSEYTIKNQWDITTTDATKRQFRRGETASKTFSLSIPEDAIPGTYTFTCWVFGQKVELLATVTILPPEEDHGPAEEADAQLTDAKAAEIENAWYIATGVALGDWFDTEVDNYADGVRYYGSYAGFQIIFRPTGDDAITDLEIEGLTFSHNTGFELYAYQAGSFRPLQEICALGALTEQDLRMIRVRHLIMEMQPSEGFCPLPTVTVDPEDDTFEQMKLAFLRQYAPDGDYTTKELSVVYYGEYGGAHVGFINGIFMYTQALTSETVGGVTFRYNTGQKLKVYYEGELMGLSEAYDRGILTQEHLIALHSAYTPKDDSAVTE